MKTFYTCSEGCEAHLHVKWAIHFEYHQIIKLRSKHKSNDEFGVTVPNTIQRLRQDFERGKGRAGLLLTDKLIHELLKVVGLEEKWQKGRAHDAVWHALIIWVVSIFKLCQNRHSTRADVRPNSNGRNIGL